MIYRSDKPIPPCSRAEAALQRKHSSYFCQQVPATGQRRDATSLQSTPLFVDHSPPSTKMHRIKVQNRSRKSGGGKLCLSRGQCKARLVAHLPSKGNNRSVYPVASPHLSLQSSGTIHPQNNVWIIRCRAKRYLKSDYKVKTSGWQAGVRPTEARPNTDLLVSQLWHECWWFQAFSCTYY